MRDGWRPEVTPTVPPDPGPALTGGLSGEWLGTRNELAKEKELTRGGDRLSA